MKIPLQTHRGSSPREEDLYVCWGLWDVAVLLQMRGVQENTGLLLAAADQRCWALHLGTEREDTGTESKQTI